MQRSKRRVSGGLLALTMVLAACSSGGSDRSDAPGTSENQTTSTTTAPAPKVTMPEVTMPEVTGPVTGPGEPWSAVASVPADAGYVTEEYFIAGDATSYVVDGELDADGHWDATPDATAGYKTRILVHRPSDAKKFNGTVVLEWLNVSAGFETAPDYLFTQRELLRGGYAWVGVSAQQVGIEESDGGGVLGIQPLKGSNPERYESLHHPGDAFSYDIYSQASAAVRAKGADKPLGGLEVSRVIADGESQSAFRMANYINAVQPLTHAFDGFLVHSRWASPTPLNPNQEAPEDTRLRTDLDVPIFQVEAETDVPKFLAARQDDTERIRTWEIAGTAHVDANVLASALGCTTEVNSGPQIYVMDAVLATLNTWIEDPGRPPAKADRIEVGADGTIVRDDHGNALGGVRTPQLDVPVATLSGEGGQGSGFCTIAGVTEPFPTSEVTAMYGSEDDYLAQFDTSMADAIDKGFLLDADAADMRDAAAQGWPTS